MDSPHALLADIQALEHRAHALNLTLVGQLLDRTKNVLGWLMAGETDEALKAFNGERE